MPAVYTSLELLQQLKGPYNDSEQTDDTTVAGWTKGTDSEGKTIWTDDINPDVVRYTRPGSTRITGFDDFVKAISMSEQDWRAFYGTVFASLDEIKLLGDTEKEKDDYFDSVQAALEEILAIIQESRVTRHSLQQLPPSRSEVGETPQEQFSRALTARILDATTYIGPIVIDPDISVVEVEVKENYDFNTLRTLRGLSDPVLKSHKNDITMSITLEYPQHLINDIVGDKGVERYGLRSLLATLKAAPVCEISSTAIVPVFVNSVLTPEVFEQIRDEIGSSLLGGPHGLEQRRKQTSRSLTAATKDATSLAAFREFVGTLDPILDFLSTPVTADEMDVDMSQIEAISGASTTLVKRSLEKGKHSISVPCAFQGAVIKTKQGHTNTMVVKLVFLRYNDQAWQRGKILYRDINGDPTTDPFLCPWITRMANLMFLENQEFGIDYMRKYVVPKVGTAGIDFTWQDTMTPKVLAYTPDPEHFILEDVELRVFMKVAKQPLVGSPYPVVQYLGIDNLQARVSFTITDPVELAKFHEMKAQLDAINYEEGEAYKRRQFVTINNNVLNFAGAQDFVIVGITTYADSRHDRWKVEMDVIENRVTVAEAEQLVLADQNTREISDLKSMWMHIYDLLSEKAIGPNGVGAEAEIYKSYPEDEKNPRSWELDAEGQAAYRLIYGKDKAGLSSLLHPNMMAAAWYYRTQLGGPRNADAVRGTQSTNVRWDTSWANDKKVAAVTEGKALLGGWEGLSSLWSNSQDISDQKVPGAAFAGQVYSAAYVPGPNGTRTIAPVLIGRRHNPVFIFDMIDRGGFDQQAFDTLEQRAFDFVTKGQYDLDDEFRWNPFTEEMGALAAEILLNVGGQSANRNVFTQGADMLAWLSVTGRKDAFFTETFWKDYFNIVMNSKVRPDLAEEPMWGNRELNRARTNMMMLTRAGGFAKFPKWRKKHGMQSFDDGMRGIRVSNPKDTEKVAYSPTVNNYADMRLPTYSTLFRENGQLMTVPDDRGGPVELWRKFAPTYSDLGKKPPFTRTVAFKNLEDAMQQIARQVNDPVDPSICYYHEKRKPAAVTAAMEAEDNANRNIEAIRAKTIVVPTSVAGKDIGGRAIGSWLEQVYSDPSRRTDPLAFGKQRENTMLRALDRNTDVKDRRQSIVLISEEGELLGTVKAGSKGINPVVFNKFERGEKYKIFNGAGIDVFDGYDKSHVAKTHLDLTARIPDMNLNMTRLFPAYRLFFIEEDNERLWMTDDLYGSNAVISMSLKTDKWDAALLTVNISNITHNLSEEQVLSPAQMEKLGLVGDEEGEPYFSRLKLQSGVKVQLRLGYGALPADLPIIFNGIITEITPGKMVQFVAQGHKRELLNEVQFDYSGLNHFDIIRKIFERSEHPNLGETVKAKDIGTAMAPHIFPNNVDPREMVSLFDRLFNEEFSTVTRNIYINSNAPQEVTRRSYFTTNSVSKTAGGAVLDGAARNIPGGYLLTDSPESRLTEAGVEATARWMGIDFWGLVPDLFSQPTTESGHWAEWVVPPQPAWDAINEVARHRPGHIVQVVPYETKGTVFMGQPEQPYLAERPNFQEELAYARLGRVMATAAQADFHRTVLGPFLDESSWYSLYKAHWAANPAAMNNMNRRDRNSFINRADRSYGYFSDKDIYSAVSDASIFVRPEDIMQLADMPKLSDQERVREGLKEDEEFHKLARKFISEAAGGDLPQNFSVEVDWWVYPNPMREQWDWLQSFDNNLVEELFYWYFDITPEIGKAILGPEWREIRHFVWWDPENSIFQHALENLDEQDNGGTARNSAYAVPYSTLSTIRGTNEGPLAGLDSQLEEIEILRERGFIDKERANELVEQVRAQRQDDIDRLSGLRPEKTRLGLRTRGAYPDPAYAKMQQIKASGGSLSEVIEETGGGFKLFLYNMYRHLQDAELDEELSRARVRNATKRMRMFDLPPGYKVFRNYHMLTGRDIIDNKIHASMSEMYNTCLVRAPVEPLEYRKEDKEFVETEGDDEDIVIEHDDTDWRSYPTSDGIAFNHRVKKANRKLGIAYELNAISTDQKAKTLMSNMGIYLAPMYRGSLTIVGRNIKPWDVVYINDPENELTGHFEVASVTHHLDASIGWVTVVEPHALVRVNNPTSELQMAFAQSLLRTLEPVIDLIDAALVVMTVAGIAGAIFTGGGSLAGSAAATALRGVISGTARVGLRLAAKQTIHQGLKSFARHAVVKFAVVDGAASGSTALALRGATTAATADAVTIGLTPGAKRFLSVLKHIGKFAGTKKGWALGLGVTGLFYGMDAYTSVYAKQQVASTNLPVDIHFLMYKNSRLQAGMELEDEDIYSIYEKFLGLANDTVSAASNLFYEAWDEIWGHGLDGNPVMQLQRGE